MKKLKINNLSTIDDVYKYHQQHTLPGLDDITEVLHGEVDFTTILHLYSVDKVLALMVKHKDTYLRTIQLATMLELNNNSLLDNIMDNTFNAVTTVTNALDTGIHPVDELRKLNVGVSSKNTLLDTYPVWYTVIVIGAYANIFK